MKEGPQHTLSSSIHAIASPQSYHRNTQLPRNTQYQRVHAPAPPPKNRKYLRHVLRGFNTLRYPGTEPNGFGHIVPQWCGALPYDNNRTKAGTPSILGVPYSLDKVMASDFHRTKLGSRTKGYRTNAGPRLHSVGTRVLPEYIPSFNIHLEKNQGQASILPKVLSEYIPSSRHSWKRPSTGQYPPQEIP